MPCPGWRAKCREWVRSFPGRQSGAALAYPWTGPGQAGAPLGYSSNAGGSALNGAWQGNSGEVLVVRDGLFRIYAGIDSYNDGRLAVHGRQLVLSNPSTGHSREYEYALHEGLLALRDNSGNVLLYRRLPPSAVQRLLR